MHNPITRLTAARFDGPQALYTEAVRLLSERPALPVDLAGLVARLREPWFTNGCEAYQREAADAIEALAAENARLAASEPQCAEVKPLAWITLEVSDWLKVYDGPACAKITAIHRVQPKSGMGVPVYSEPLTIRPEAEVRAEAWGAAIEAAISAAESAPTPDVPDEYRQTMAICDAIRAMITADASAVLDRIKTEAKAKGMREAARIAKSRAGSLDYEPPSPYDRGYAAAVAEVERAILAAIQEGAK